MRLPRKLGTNRVYRFQLGVYICSRSIVRFDLKYLFSGTLYDHNSSFHRAVVLQGYLTFSFCCRSSKGDILGDLIEIVFLCFSPVFTYCHIALFFFFFLPFTGLFTPSLCASLKTESHRCTIFFLSFLVL